eukprot:6534104-Pyramimonas_sp.AAC.1
MSLRMGVTFSLVHVKKIAAFVATIGPMVSFPTNKKLVPSVGLINTLTRQVSIASHHDDEPKDDKDAKIAYLTKMINVVGIASGASVPVKPQKVSRSRFPAVSPEEKFA